MAELERAADRPAHEIVRLESLAEELLAQGAPTARSLARFVGGFEERVGTAMERGVVALKSIAAARGGLWLFTESGQADRRRAFANLDKAASAARFEDPVLLPFLVRRAAELAATRQVPLQFSTGIGDEDVYLPHADPGLLWPMLRDPRTEDCPVVLLGCYPYVGGAAHLAGTYPQVHMDLSPGSSWPSRSRPGWCRRRSACALRASCWPGRAGAPTPSPTGGARSSGAGPWPGSCGPRSTPAASTTRPPGTRPGASWPPTPPGCTGSRARTGRSAGRASCRPA